MSRNRSPRRKRIFQETTNRATLRVDEALTPASDDALLTVPEAARILNVSRGLIYQMIHAGELPRIAIHSTVRIRRRDLDQLIKSSWLDRAKAQAPEDPAEQSPEGRVSKWRREHDRD